MIIFDRSEYFLVETLVEMARSRLDDFCNHIDIDQNIRVAHRTLYYLTNLLREKTRECAINRSNEQLIDFTRREEMSHSA